MQMTARHAPLRDPDMAFRALTGTAATGAADSGGSAVTAGVHGVPLTVSVPDGPMRGGIIVVQEAYGVNEHIAAVTRKLAAQGYLAVAPHLYHRVADAPVDTFPAARPLMSSLNGDDLRHDLDDALEYLTAGGVDGDRIGIVGFSMGGTVALWSAATLPVAAAVTFYGAGISKPRWRGVPAGLESAAGLRAPWLGLYGDKDRSITVDEVERLRSTLGSSGVAATIVRYPDAGHAFATDPDSSKHVPEAAKDAWSRALSWFDAHLR
jgi:carboxymethylenebutenolidase